MKGLVLAGGKSSRFGKDKANARRGGESFLEHSVSLLKAAGIEPYIVARKDQNYSAGCPVLWDLLPEKGPIGGLYTAMLTVKCASFLTLTCDMPALTSDVLARLLAEHTPPHAATFYATSEGDFEPFPGIYEPSLLPLLRSRILEDRLSMRGFLNEAPLKKILPWSGNPLAFLNVNSPKDLEEISIRQ